MNDDYYIAEDGSIHNKQVKKNGISKENSSCEFSRLLGEKTIEKTLSVKGKNKAEDLFWRISVIMAVFIGIIMSILLSDWSLITENADLRVIYPLTIIAGAIEGCFIYGLSSVVRGKTGLVECIKTIPASILGSLVFIVFGSFVC